MEIQSLRQEMASWPVQWRWEGASGHPRRITDSLVQTLEDQGYEIDLADVPLTQGPLGNVGEFEGALIARRRQSRGDALRRKWAAAAVGVVLAPVLVGLFILKYALEGKRYGIGVEWRGEAYPTSARADQGGYGAERSGIVSDVRVTMRAAVVDAGQVSRDAVEMQPALERVQWTLGESLPSLTMPAGAPQRALDASAGAAALDAGAATYAIESGDGSGDGGPEPPPSPPSLGEGRTK